MKIAIVGSGISSLTAAYLLADKHDVSVIEFDDRIGGHTATKTIDDNGKKIAIDTGFIVYNDWTYPNFIKLLDKLGVASRPTEMSFSVSDNISGTEYSGTNINTLFAQRLNLFRPSFWRMIRDILRFNKQALGDWQHGRIADNTSLGHYLRENNYSEVFVQQYLIPMGAAIWSCADEDIMDFPVTFFIRFFHNHGLLSVNNRPQWRTLVGGSSVYLKPLTETFKDNIRLNCVITQVRRIDNKVQLEFANGDQETFDEIIFGCHSDQALGLLGDASSEELQILSAIPYEHNEVVLHTDTSILPARRLAWSSWNSRLLNRNHSKPVLSYNMNILQGIESEQTYCVTLNHTAAINPETIIGTYHYHHPVFSVDGLAAQQRWSEINGVNSTWFCGAYWGNGFHEDGVASGVKVAVALGAQW